MSTGCRLCSPSHPYCSLFPSLSLQSGRNRRHNNFRNRCNLPPKSFLSLSLKAGSNPTFVLYGFAGYALWFPLPVPHPARPPPPHRLFPLPGVPTEIWHIFAPFLGIGGYAPPQAWHSVQPSSCTAHLKPGHDIDRHSSALQPVATVNYMGLLCSRRGCKFYRALARPALRCHGAAQ